MDRWLSYEQWSLLPRNGKRRVREKGNFDVVVHQEGEGAVMREAVTVKNLSFMKLSFTV